MQRAAVEGILGLHRRGDVLTVSPCLPAAWPGYAARIVVAGTEISVQVTQGAAADAVALDGAAIDHVLPVRVPLDRRPHSLQVELR